MLPILGKAPPLVAQPVTHARVAGYLFRGGSVASSGLSVMETVVVAPQIRAFRGDLQSQYGEGIGSGGIPKHMPHVAILTAVFMLRVRREWASS